MKNEIQKRNRVSAEVKQQIVKMILEDGMKIPDIAYQFNIGKSTISSWLKMYKDEQKKDPNEPMFYSSKEYEKVKADYEKKLRDLEEENEILKKAMHIFAKNRK